MMSQSKIKTKSGVKVGRPSLNRTKKEHREYLKLRSREYYSNSENKEKQRLKMVLYRAKNKEKINRKRKAKRARDRLEKNLKIIWSNRGLLK